MLFVRAICCIQSSWQSLSLPIIFALACAQTTQAQDVQAGIYALDTPFDPRSIAMGESFVALRGNTYAMMYNPAGLAGVQGVSISFSRRNFNWVTSLDEFKYIAFSGTMKTSFANFGVIYNKFHKGEFTVTTMQNPEGIGKVRVSDYVFGVGVSRSLPKGLDLGINIKTFRQVFDIIEGNPPPIGESNTPLIFDFGMLYTHTGNLRNQPAHYSLTLGLALQNYGTDYKVKTQSSFPIGQQVEEIVKLPSYLRSGVAFAVSILPEQTEQLMPAKFLFTAEYRNLLNASESQHPRWGFGAEVLLFEILAARIGEFIQPVRSIYGTEGNPTVRYGFGVWIPFQRFGAETPLTLRVEYAAIPVNTQLGFSLGSDINPTLSAFSIELQYENNLF